MIADRAKVSVDLAVQGLAKWTGRPRTGNAAHRKASASSKRPVVEAEAAGDAVAVGAGVKKSQLRWLHLRF